MLPGFRFLFAAIMLSMSLLVFGLGAAALLRAAHESFASNSSWRAAPEVPFAQHPETTPPVLATLRVEPNAMEKANDPAKLGAAAADPQPPVAESASTEQVAAVGPTEMPTAETAKPADAPGSIPAAGSPQDAEAASIETASPSGEATVAAEPKITAVTASDAAPGEPAAAEFPARAEPVISEPTNPTTGASATAPEASTAAMKIATLGGPPVDVAASAPETRAAKSDRAKSDQDTIQRAQARRTIRRRRLAARAQLLTQQLQANPFGPQPSFAPAAPRR
jgi:hypothetical protein